MMFSLSWSLRRLLTIRMNAEMRPQTQEEYDERQRREELFDYYGIPYGVFDGGDKLPDNIETDWSKAIALISKGQEIPKDLEIRLLDYKERNYG